MKQFYKRLIDYYTFNRIDYSDENMKSLVDECIAQLIALDEDLKNKVAKYDSDGKKSESIGSQKVEYLTLDIDKIANLERKNNSKIYKIIKVYFGHTGLMYRGVLNANEL
ncbi:MAG: hypothetical protein E6249_04545 [Peptoniphilus grossensis]|uniref:hypothetical protein n=1 Tax=Peptoniphilus grossensis TaxID=1465756 RepID=UPI00290DB3C4|nr:hypothetical protein [Peptoniphilus grossensis]MDU5099720.1 hypothetical protein [Peptoniphilus grossensis]